MAKGDRAIGIEISFDASRCLHVRSVWAECSLCADSCPSDSIFFDSQEPIPQLNLDNCVNCGQCLSACPLDAFSSPRFSERKLLGRVEHINPLRLRCFMPYGDAEVMDAGQDYQLGACLAAITPGALAEMAFSRQCVLVVDRCKECQLYGRVWPTLQCNEQIAAALLADWGRAANLRESSPLFLSEDEGDAAAVGALAEGLQPGEQQSCTARATDAPDASDILDASDVPDASSSSDSSNSTAVSDALHSSDLSDTIKSSVRALFHGRRRKREAERRRRASASLKLQAKRRHVPLWRMRLEELWRSNKPNHPGHFPWPKQTVDEGLCKACGVCMQLCPTGTIQHDLKDGVFTYGHTPGRCTNCGLCIEACPSHALSRDYQNLEQPFDEQVCMQWPAHACKRCGLPAREGTGDLCILCANEPDAKKVAGRIRNQMYTWLHA
ncbi:MAG: 4Fe-4S binding protein [Eggerthellaceae bacterium]|nr:4Fe-4S binding protein [Eggerthellaceae bacterium]